MFLTRSDILEIKDVAIQEVYVDEWGGAVGIRTFDAATRAALLKPAKDGDMPLDWMERIVVACVCDESGNLLFTQEDVIELGKKNATVLEKIFTEAIELNGLTDTSREKLQGESEPTPK